MNNKEELINTLKKFLLYCKIKKQIVTGIDMLRNKAIEVLINDLENNKNTTYDFEKLNNVDVNYFLSELITSKMAEIALKVKTEKSKVEANTLLNALKVNESSNIKNKKDNEELKS